jgi:glutamine amidotransferase-like uncharacterized protein
LTATFQQIQELVDDRLYQVEYYSQAPNRIQSTRSNPVALFVVPGGDFNETAEELRPLVPLIQNLVMNDGAGFLGICNGAIAAAPNLLSAWDKNSLGVTQMSDWVGLKKIKLNLYSESCAVWAPSPTLTAYSAPQVHKNDLETNPKPFNAYFSQGVFFPLSTNEWWDDVNIRPLLFYSGEFKGTYTPPGGSSYTRFYAPQKPAAAVAEKVGKGSIVLSGVHPEIGAEIVSQFNTKNDKEKTHKSKVVHELQPYEAEQTELMKCFLDALSIVTKTVKNEASY